MTLWDYFLYVLHSIGQFFCDLPMYVIGFVIACIMSIANCGHPGG